MEKLVEVAVELLKRDQQWTIVFPSQDIELIASSLASIGVNIEEMKSKQDRIEVVLKPKE